MLSRFKEIGLEPMKKDTYKTN